MIRETLRRHFLAMTSEVITNLIQGTLDSRSGVPVEKFNRLADQVHLLERVVGEMAPPSPGFFLTASLTKRIVWGNGDIFVNICRNDDGTTWRMSIDQLDPCRLVRIAWPIPLQFQSIGLGKLRALLLDLDASVERGCLPRWLSNPDQSGTVGQ